MSTLKLPAATLKRLNQKLRANHYGQLVETANWLHEMGHEISKSAVHRYAVRLRSLDAKNGVLVASIMATPTRLRGRSPISGTRGRSGSRRIEQKMLDDYRKLSPENQLLAARMVEELLTPDPED